VFRTCSRQQRSFDLDALELAGYTCLITSLGSEVLSCNAVMDLYRFRWQIELAFRRLNGLLLLERLPPSDPQLWRSVIFAKLLAALIINDYRGRYLDSYPWGYRLGEQPAVAPAD
jgi:IS4 transposase